MNAIISNVCLASFRSMLFKFFKNTVLLILRYKPIADEALHEILHEVLLLEEQLTFALYLLIELPCLQL